MLPITGDTYDIRDQLKGLGCRWDEDQQCWMAPDDGARAMGQHLADGEPWRKWRVFYSGLVWTQGHFKNSTFEAALNARSRGLPLDASKAELRSHIVACGAKPPLEWIERDVTRAYQMAEPPRERPSSRGSMGQKAEARGEKGPAWPSEWREEMRPGAWVNVQSSSDSASAQPRAFCSRFALRFYDAGAEISAAELVEIQRLDAHLKRLRERVDEEADAPAELAKPKFEETKLSAFAGPWKETVDALWLCDRSPIEPTGVDSDRFLRTIYEPGERVIVLDVFASQGQWVWSHDNGFAASRIDFQAWDGNDREHKQAPAVRDGAAFRARGPQGIWYLCNPVSGEFRPTAEHDKWGRQKWSRRFEDVVITWRYFVFESDEADPREWMGAIVQMPLRIVAIYTSGGGPTASNPKKKTSIHVLVRVDAESKAQFDLWRETAKRVMIPLGADPGCMSAVRLTRLPGCIRELDKDGQPWPKGPREQKLLFLDPEASDVPLIDRPTVRDTLGTWERVVYGVTHGAVSDEGELSVESLIKGLSQFKSPRSRSLIDELRRWKGAP